MADPPLTIYTRQLKGNNIHAGQIKTEIQAFDGSNINLVSFYKSKATVTARQSAQRRPDCYLSPGGGDFCLKDNSHAIITGKGKSIEAQIETRDKCISHHRGHKSAEIILTTAENSRAVVETYEKVAAEITLL